MEQAKFDRRIADLYDEVIKSRYHTEEVYLAELMKIIPENSSVLEIGCGTGEIAISLNDSGRKCEGLDSSDNMLFRLKEKSGIKIYLAEAQTFIPEKDYDFVVSCSGPFSIKEGELESYILDFDVARKCLEKFARLGRQGILINKGVSKEPIQITLRNGKLFRHREITERDYTIMVHLLYEGTELLDEITHVKRRYNLNEMLSGARVTDYERFKIIKF